MSAMPVNTSDTQPKITRMRPSATGKKGEWGSTLVWADRIKPDSWWYSLFLAWASRDAVNLADLHSPYIALGD